MPHSLYNGVHYVPAPYILSMSCVSGDEVQIVIHRKEDIFRWLKKLDHEGSNWDVVEHLWSNDYSKIMGTSYITSEIIEEYANQAC
jgi:hypothetical protein